MCMSDRTEPGPRGETAVSTDTADRSLDDFRVRRGVKAIVSNSRRVLLVRE